MNIVWACNECDFTAPATGAGHNEIMRHVKEEHGKKPSEGARGVVDLDTGETLVHGCGPRVLQQAQKLGYVEAKQKKPKKAEPQGFPSSEEGEPSNVIPLPEKPSKGRGKSSSGQVRVPKASVLAENVALDPMIYMLFYEARLRWPDKYPDSGSASLSQFLLDAVMITGMSLGMDGGRIIAEGVSRMYVGEEV